MHSVAHIRPLLAVTCVLNLLAGCANTTTPPFDIGYQPGSDPDTSVDLEIEALEHCGAITTDETWTAAFSPHLVTCKIQITSGATLTIEPGVLVEFATSGSISVGVSDEAGGLQINGEEGLPVLLRPSERGQTWGGVQVGGLAAPVGLLHTTLEGAGLQATNATLTLSHVDILDAPTVGLELEGASLTSASGALLITGSGTYPVVVDADAAHTIPAGGSLYVGNTTDRVFVEDLPISEPVAWANLGIPWHVSGTLDLKGSPWRPAVLTLQEGVEVIFASGAGIQVGTGFNASAGLLSQGTEASPVRLIADPLLPASTWEGIAVGAGALTNEVMLSHTLLERAGDGNSDDAAISVQDSEISLKRVVIERAPGPGVQLLGSATFSNDSADITVRKSGYSMWLSPGAVASAPLDTLVRDGNTDDHMLLDTADWGTITGTLHLKGLGIPWRPNNSIVVRGTATAPARLEVDPGVEVELLPGDRVEVAYPSGAAELVMDGDASAPITFTGATANEPGAWVGFILGPHCVASETTLDWVIVQYAGQGGGDDDANFILDGCTPSSWGTLKVDYSLGWGALFIDTNTTTFGLFASQNERGDVDCRGTSTSCD